MTEPYKIFHQPSLAHPTLIVSWAEDAGRLGPTVVEYLIEKITASCFCEIEPVPFFSMGGITINNDVACFPEIKFYAGLHPDLIILKAAQPQFERYQFLNTLLDVAQHYCQTKQLLTLGGTIAPLAHTQPRRLLAVYNHRQFQKKFQDPDLENMTFQGPPALSSYLLWVGQKRDLPGVSLWTEIPFYLTPYFDHKAILQTLAFLNKKFNLDLNLLPVQQNARRQNQLLDQLRDEDLTINQYLSTLESGLNLNQQEQLELSQKISQLLEN